MHSKTEAIDILRARFGHGEWKDLLERWVSYAVGVDRRDECLGPQAIERAIKRLDVALKSDADLLFDGELRLIDDRKTIFLREGIERSRINFTIAHELGHATLFQLEPSLTQESQQVERICNRFAAELLLPDSSVRKAIADGYARALVKLAARSGASLTSTCIRITECFGGAAGIASADGEILRAYGQEPGSVEIATHLSSIASAKERSFLAKNVSQTWVLETGFIRSKYIYVLRRSGLVGSALESG